jgi:hypothetical protein
VGTGALVVATVVAVLADGDGAALANLIVSGLLFLGGCAAFALGFVVAAARSRHEMIDLAGLFYLTGSSPRPVRQAMLGLWFAQIGVVVVTITSIDPPFGVMAPVWGIGLITVWTARHGTFPTRAVADGSARRSGPQ